MTGGASLPAVLTGAGVSLPVVRASGRTAFRVPTVAPG